MDSPDFSKLDPRSVIESGPYSNSLKDVLGRARVNREMAMKGGTPESSVSVHTQYSLLGTLWHAAAPQTADGGAGRAFANHRAFARALTVDEIRTHTEGDLNGNDQLATALVDALTIRSQTGGPDDFIGLRHALYAIMLPEDPKPFADTYRLLSANGTDPVALARDIAAFCVNNPQKGENLEIWESLTQQRLPRLISLAIPVGGALQVATPSADDPYAPGKIDRSGAQLEAEAFASMICWRDFTPPLAVGVFGDWGAGKSFFMRLVQDAIAARTGAGSGTAPDGFLSDVVQIRFNAWHYAETNLWASLVDHILTELDGWAATHNTDTNADDIFAKLDTARESTLEAAREVLAQLRAKAEAQTALADATKELEAKQQELAKKVDTWREGVWTTVLSETLLPKAAQAAADLGLTKEVLKTPEDLRRAIELYDPNKGGAATQDWLRFAGSKPRWGIGLAAALVILPPALGAAMTGLNLSATGGAVAGVVAPMAAFLTAVSTKLRAAHATLSGAHLEVQKEIEAQTATEAAERAEAEAALEAAERAAAAAEAHLRDTEAALQSAEKDYRQETGAGRILQFIRQRVTSGDYRKQLGFIAKIRRDFDELSRLMSHTQAPVETEERRARYQAEVDALLREAGDTLKDRPDITARLRASYAAPDPDNAPRVFQRIVLYIDDLDRCPSDQVKVVLEAIHLLLAYPLFVVFVAVDVRWLEHSLKKEFFGESDTSGESFASASDYLEKIIQVPYWVRAMTPANTEDLLTDLMALSDAPPGTDATPAPDSTAASAGETPDPGGDEQAPESTQTPQPPQPPSPTEMEFTPDEAAFVKALSIGLDGSPRRTLRFVNSYRLIKASLPLAERRRLKEGGYRALLALLAVQVCSDEVAAGTPDQADSFKALIAQLAKDPNKVTEWADGLVECPETARLKAVLSTYKQNGGVIEDLAKQSDVVARFGFLTP